MDSTSVVGLSVANILMSNTLAERKAKMKQLRARQLAKRKETVVWLELEKGERKCEDIRLGQRSKISKVILIQHQSATRLMKVMRFADRTLMMDRPRRKRRRRRIEMQKFKTSLTRIVFQCLNVTHNKNDLYIDNFVLILIL